MKKCNLCNKEKEYKDFPRVKQGSKILKDTCRNCNKKIIDKKYKDEVKLKNSTLTEFTCKECKLTKPSSDFASNKTYCKLCSSIYHKKRREANLEEYRQSDRESRRKAVEWIRSFKKDPCKDCGKTFDPEFMDFDHVSGDKIDNVSRLVLSGRSNKTILEEIAKCELVCCLCHNIRTMARYDSKRKYKREELSPSIQRNLNYIDECKNVPCYICGIQRELCNMQFDHIDKKNKLYNVCSLKGAPLNELKAEIEKCKIICTLCHRKKSLSEQLKKYEDKINGIYNPDNEPKEKIIKPKRDKSFIDYENKKKQCFSCKEVKDFNRFNVTEKRRINRCTYCMDCINAYRRYKRKEKALTVEPKKTLDKSIKKKKVKEILFIDYENEKKECSKCRNIKNFSEFFICPDRKLEHNLKCRNCLNSERRIKRKQENK